MWLFTLASKYVRFKQYVFKRKTFSPKPLSSKGERMVAYLLEKNKISYYTQYPFGCLHVDFCVIIKGKIYFIEYDGRQHYHPVKRFGGIAAFCKQKAIDTLMNLECKDRKMPLLRIKYDLPFNQIENRILTFLNTISFFLFIYLV